MGADFLYSLVPKCKITAERVKALRAYVAGLTEVELAKINMEAGGMDYEIAELKELVDDYWELDGKRDVAILQLDSQQIPYWITGGQSFGDSPTDSFDVMSKIRDFDELYAMLAKWAKEDVENFLKTSAANELPATL